VKAKDVIKRLKRDGYGGLEMTYQAVFEPADDGSVFAYVPDLPGCTSWGATVEDARKNVREAIALWIDVATERGIRVPPPSDVAASAENGAA
jgi:antitoxin HicB